jgi:hypothetical protein
VGDMTDKPDKKDATLVGRVFAIAIAVVLIVLALNYWTKEDDLTIGAPEEVKDSVTDIGRLTVKRRGGRIPR